LWILGLGSHYIFKKFSWTQLWFPRFLKNIDDKILNISRYSEAKINHGIKKLIKVYFSNQTLIRRCWKILLLQILKGRWLGNTEKENRGCEPTSYKHKLLIRKHFKTYNSVSQIMFHLFFHCFFLTSFHCNSSNKVLWSSFRKLIRKSLIRRG